jgi:hypothetical protein
MAYATLSDLTKLLPVETIIQLTDDEHDATDIIRVRQ